VTVAMCVWVISGHTDKSGALSALPPIADVGRRIQVSIWLAVCFGTTTRITTSTIIITIIIIMGIMITTMITITTNDWGTRKLELGMGLGQGPIPPVARPWFERQSLVRLARLELGQYGSPDDPIVASREPTPEGCDDSLHLLLLEGATARWRTSVQPHVTIADVEGLSANSLTRQLCNTPESRREACGSCVRL
jgi:hypothetical protein